MEVLVTGGAGFIGSHIVDELLKKKHTVTVLDIIKQEQAGNLGHCLDKITYLQGDICDSSLVLKACRNKDHIFHQAAKVSVPESISNPQLYEQVNVQGHLNILQAARSSSVKRVICASSCAVYGDPIEIPQKETTATYPKSPYAESKLKAEQHTKYFFQRHGMETVSLRYFNVFGPRQQDSGAYASVIPLFIKKMLQNQQPTIYGEGNQSRDFIHVKNVAAANVLMLSAEGVAGEVYNVCTGLSHNLNQLVDHINKILNKDIKPVNASPRAGDIHTSRGDPQKLLSVGFRPIIEFKQGLQNTIEWIKAQ